MLDCLIFQIYLPSYLIVILAWVSFWVDREQTAARIAMGITTVLTMATLIGSARVSLPKVSYVKSLEWFLIMCFLFVFSAILEYSFVSYLVFRQRIKNREEFARDAQVCIYILICSYIRGRTALTARTMVAKACAMTYSASG